VVADPGVTSAPAGAGMPGKEGTHLENINTNVYATQPTCFTLFLRTFLPWQLWRFFCINLNMMLLIGREKRIHQ
jgi:hypothetical protein